MSAKPQQITHQLRSRRHRPVAQTCEWLKSVVQGYFNYHAVTGNIDSLGVYDAGDPDCAEARNALGELYLDQRNSGAAQAELSEAIRLNPRFAWAHFNLGRLFSQTGRK